jgi:DNA-binding CsgD family transcriptional regulator
VSNDKIKAGIEKGRKEISDKELYTILYNRFGITKKKFQEYISQQKLLVDIRTSLQSSFPIIILRTELSGLEAIVKYLRENRQASYKEIGILLKRNPKTLAVTYKIAKSKLPSPYSSDIDETKERIEYSAFSNKLSVLESICHYLRIRNMTYSQIATLISKNPRTVWTVCKRAEKKLGERQDG